MGATKRFVKNIHKDNDIYGLTGDPFCIIAVGQDVVSDGCYVPKSGVVVTPSSASSVPQTISGAGSATVPSSTPITTTISGGWVTATITANGTIQTVVVADNNHDRKFNYSSDFVLPIVLSMLGVILIAICLGAWLWRKRMRLQRELLMNRGVGLVSVYTGRRGSRMLIYCCLAEPTLWDRGSGKGKDD
jgi:hypothetical protein